MSTDVEISMEEALRICFDFLCFCVNTRGPLSNDIFDGLPTEVSEYTDANMANIELQRLKLIEWCYSNNIPQEKFVSLWDMEYKNITGHDIPPDYKYLEGQ